MGEIEMWEQWRKVGEGQEGRGREVQHADVSAVANETGSATSGGITGEGGDSAAKTDRRLEEREAGLDTPRGQGAEKVLEGQGEQGTRAGQTGAYVRTGGDVRRRTVTEQRPGDATRTGKRAGEHTTGLQTPGSSGFDEGQAGHGGQGQRTGRTGTEVRTRGDVLRQKKREQVGSGEGREGETSKVNLETPKEKSKTRKKKKSRNSTGGYAD